MSEAVASHTDEKEVNRFLSFGFNTKIQRYHTSPSQISSFTLEPKLEEKGEEKRLLGKKGGTEKVKQQIPDARTFTCLVTFSVTSGNGHGC